MKRITAALLFTTLAGSALANPSLMSAEQASRALARAKAAMENNPGLDAVPGQVIVKFRNGDEGLKGLARNVVNGRTIRNLKGVQGLEHLEVGMPVDQAVEVLSALPFVEYAEPDYIVRPLAAPNDQFIGLQWGVNNTGQSVNGVTGTPDADIDGFEAWDVRTSAANIIVAVIDSGVQWSHPDLDGNIWVNGDEIAGNGIDDDGNGYVDDVRGWDFFDNDNNPDDTDGHGTHCAGTVGAEGNNGIGVAGVAWDVQIMPLRFIGPFGGSTSDAIEAVNYAVANGAKISNNSWGGGGFNTALRDAIANAGANDHLFVAAAGNNGANADQSPSYPAAYPNDNIISVAATDSRDRLASFSNYGVNSVDLGAPGVTIASTYSGSGYVYLSGTSMASPHVAGAAAVLWAENPTWTYAQVRDRLYATVRPTSAMNGTTATGGVLNLQAALGNGGGGGGEPPANTAPSVSIAAPSGGSSFVQGTSVTFWATASDSEDGNLGASVVWTSSRDGQFGTGATFSTSSLSVGTHTITASVTDSGGLSDSATTSITITEQPTAQPPATPGGFSVVDNADGTAGISWGDVADESGYEIEREKAKRNGGWNGTQIVGSTGADVTTFTDASGTGTFQYRVRAVNAAGVSNWSGWIEVTVTDASGGGGGGGNGNGRGNNRP